MLPRLAAPRLVAVLPIVGAAILAAILFPVFARARENARRSSCQSNLKQIAIATMQYLQDYDEQYPLARQAGARVGWTDILLPYTRTAQVFRCPTVSSEPLSRDYNGSLRTDYFYNSRFSAYRDGRDAATANNAALIVLNGDGEHDSGVSAPHYAIGAIPPAWLSSEESPAKRHLEGSNYAFADGHVKWIRDSHFLGTARPAAGQYTFAPR